ncbi:MAG TPA: hypothetical protein VMG74_12055 [Gaiellaceae bacterium]|nr:hypothetical protein [Gaiellaceae bacterium]
MAEEIDAPAEEATPTYLKAGDPALADYSPAWLRNLADDVTLEGSMMDGAVQGADAVRTLLVYIRSLYEDQEFCFARPISENVFLEDYTARVQGQPIGNLVQITFNADGQTQHIVGNYRPRGSLLLLSRLIGDQFAGTPYGHHFAHDEE